MAKEAAKNKRLYQLVGIILLLALILIALIWFYLNQTKPPTEIGKEVPAGINHIKSIYGPGAGDNFDKPESTGLDEEGNIYVADTGNNRVVVFDSNGNFLRTVGDTKSTPYPLGVVISAEGRIYVTSLMQRQLSILDEQGKTVKIIKTKKKEETPLRVTIYNNKLYITAIGQIIVADLNGKVEKRWGKEGRALGNFEYPNGIVIGKAGKIDPAIIISDSNNNRIQILSMDGKPKAYKGQPPKSLKDESLLFGLPNGVAMDDEGRIFVADTFNHAVRIFDNEGNDLGQLGAQGSADGRYYYLTDIKLVEGNRFIIADKWNDRIQICELTVGETETAKKSKPAKERVWYNPLTWF